MDINEILLARENRYHLIQSFHDAGVIVIKANIPGNDKNLPIAFLLIDVFLSELKKLLIIDKEIFIESADGPYYLVVVKRDKEIKRILINLEDYHPLGRFIDLDLYINQERSISRSDLKIKPRKCMICSDDAIKCIRQKKHPMHIIIKHIEDGIKNYISEFARNACLIELNLEDKFGLVTPSSSGSHPDMNYQLMKTAINVISPSFGEMFMAGLYEDYLQDAYKRGKQIGIDAEKLMFNATNNINCYKGLIFILGLTCISLGYIFQKRLKYENLYQNVAIMTKDIFHEPKYQTFGEYAYEKYRFGGAKGEAYCGLKNVQKAVNNLNSYEIINDEALHMTLIKIIKDLDDTVMLKRANGIENYHYYKNLIMDIKDYDLNKIREVTNTFIKNNISCGGAADILITALFIHQLQRKFW